MTSSCCVSRKGFQIPAYCQRWAMMVNWNMFVCFPTHQRVVVTQGIPHYSARERQLCHAVCEYFQKNWLHEHKKQSRVYRLCKTITILFAFYLCIDFDICAVWFKNIQIFFLFSMALVYYLYLKGDENRVKFPSDIVSHRNVSTQNDNFFFTDFKFGTTQYSFYRRQYFWRRASRKIKPQPQLD